MTKKNAGPVAYGAQVVAAGFLALALWGIISTFKRLSEAGQNRTFGAGIVAVEVTQHPGFDCPKLHEKSPAADVTRVTFDREVTVWSENGKGNGEIQVTRSVDLEGLVDLEALKSLAGGDLRIFQYSLGFLSVCDGTRIPTIRQFKW